MTTVKVSEAVRVRCTKRVGRTYGDQLVLTRLVGMEVSRAITLLEREMDLDINQPILVNEDKVRRNSARPLKAGDILFVDP